jgi:dienelactone hydrolase
MSQLIEYRDGDTLLEGYLAAPAGSHNNIPAVIIAHDWSGKNKFSCGKADKMAELGYAGFALDMFGKGKSGTTKEEKSALIQPLVSDRATLLKRILAAYETVKNLPGIDAGRIAAIGFCFGGLCVLDLARSGAPLAGVISFHGLLSAPANSDDQKIRAKILALHGYDDPMVPPDAVITFANEMTSKGADWQVHLYGNTMHAFTNPEAHDPGFGTVYQQTADKRSWQSMLDFFGEIF